MKKAFALILAVMFMLPLAACGGGGAAGGGFTGVDHSNSPAGDEPAGGGQAETPPPAMPVAREGTLGDYHVEIKETSKIDEFGFILLYVDFTFTNESEKPLDDIPLIVTAYQDGVEIESSVNPEQEATKPGGSALLETMYMLDNDESDVTVRLEVRGDPSAGYYEKVIRLGEVPEKEPDSDNGQGDQQAGDSLKLASMKQAVIDADYQISDSIDYYTDPSIPKPVGGFTVLCDGLKYGVKVMEFAQPDDAVAYAEFVSNKSDGVYSLDVIVVEYGLVGGDNFTEEMEGELLGILAAALNSASTASSSKRPGGADVDRRVNSVLGKAAAVKAAVVGSGAEIIGWPSSALPAGFPAYPDGEVVYVGSEMPDDVLLIIEGSAKASYSGYLDTLARAGWQFDQTDEDEVADLAFYGSWMLILMCDEEYDVILYVWDSGMDFSDMTYAWPENLPVPLPRDADAEVIYVYTNEESGSFDIMLAGLSQAAADSFKSELISLGWGRADEEIEGFDSFEIENGQGEWSLLLNFDSGVLTISVFCMGSIDDWDQSWPEDLPVQIPAYTDGTSVSSTGGETFYYINVEGTSQEAADGYKRELIGAGWAESDDSELRKEIDKVTWEIYLGYNEALESLLIRLSRVY